VSTKLSSVTRVGFLMLNEFTMIAFSSAIEVLRMANYLSGKPLYSWCVISPDGQPVASSNGLALAPTSTYETAGPLDLVFVCGGTSVTRFVDDQVLALLRRIADDKVILGGLCTGTYALVKAGLLNGYQAAIHWENLSALLEAHTKVKFVEELFVIDRDRITCTGGIAPVDMMLTVVRERCGKTLVAEISEQFILEQVRDSKYRQHIPLAARMGCNHKALMEVAALMEANIEEPLSLEELSQLAGLSQRHLQRMFREALDVTPSHYYLDLRLRRARELLLQTEMSITSITVACGFQSACHFSKSYRAQFGKPPSSERRPQGAAGASRDRRTPVAHHAAT
jgi:transcriptional regulator GlxA family with amidase domain